MRRQSTPLLRQILIPLGLTCLAGYIQWALWDWFKPMVWLLFYPAVFFSSWIGGRLGGLIATFLSTGLVLYFFVAPAGTFYLDDLNVLYAVAVFIVMGVLASHIHHQLSLTLKHLSISERSLKQSNEDLERRMDERAIELAAIFNSSRDAIGVSKNGRHVMVNPAYQAMFGYTAEELIDTPIIELIAPVSQPQVIENIHRRARGEAAPTVYEVTAQRKDGSTFLMDVHASTYMLWEAQHTLVILRDITEQRRAEEKLKHISRLYLTISQINQGIVRAAEKETLFTQACQVMVQYGGYRLAWVGLVDPDSGDIEPCAVYGNDDGYVDQLKLNVRAERFAPTPSVAAWREGRVVVIDDIQACSAIQPWHAVTAHHSLHSIAAIPLNQSQKVIGLLMIYSEARGAFTKDEITLLEEISLDLSYALDAFALEAQSQAAAAAQQISDERLRTFFDNIESIVWIKDLAGRFLSVNKYTCNILGLTQEQILGRTVYDLFPQSHAVPYTENDRQVIASGRAMVFEETTALADGLHTYNSVKFPLADHTGEVYGLGAVCTDITRRKQAEDALSASEAKFRSYIDHAPLAIFVADRSGQYVEVNKAATEMLGYSEAELLRRRIPDIIPEDQHETVEQGMARLAEQGFTEGEFQLVRQDQQRIWVNLLAVRLNPERDLAFCQDISIRKQAAEAMHRATDELARSNTELQMFAYIASHDLQEPLRMISSYLQLIERRYKGRLDANADDFITFAVEGAKRMQRLIEDLLSYSRVGTSGRAFDLADCHQAFSQAVSNLSASIDETGARVVASQLPTVQGDMSQLIQLFQNLIGNGIKFRKPGQPPTIQVSADQVGNEWRFTVRDNGIGIEAQYAERIFVIFQRLHTRGEYPGTGIGLAICKKIIERHGGRIWVESQLGVGASFCFTLPVLEKEPL